MAIDTGLDRINTDDEVEALKVVEMITFLQLMNSLPQTKIVWNISRQCFKIL